MNGPPDATSRAMSAAIRRKETERERQSFTADEVREMLRKACDAAGGQSEWARQHGLGRSYVSLVLLGKAGPGGGIARGLGLKQIVRFVLDGGGAAQQRVDLRGIRDFAETNNCICDVSGSLHEPRRCRCLYPTCRSGRG